MGSVSVFSKSLLTQERQVGFYRDIEKKIDEFLHSIIKT